ncbi:MAG: hypothetical protein DME23_11735 [Verrucomicrobia bacterium]|nr:MAG: hypothetical protein DME23_11735 [Verrucomicrobiota bacterium]
MRELDMIGDAEVQGQIVGGEIEITHIRFVHTQVRQGGVNGWPKPAVGKIIKLEQIWSGADRPGKVCACGVGEIEKSHGQLKRPVRRGIVQLQVELDGEIILSCKNRPQWMMKITVHSRRIPRDGQVLTR